MYPPAPWANNRPDNIVYLDIKTTGSTEGDEILSIVLVSDRGEVLLDSYLTPSRIRTWRQAEAMHGISPDFIFGGDFPTPAGLEPKLWTLLDGQRVVIYNASAAGNFLARAWPRFPVYAACCMNRYARHVGIISPKPHDVTGYKSWKLTEATAATGYVWTTRPHSAKGDALATRHVWQFLDKQG